MFLFALLALMPLSATEAADPYVPRIELFLKGTKVKKGGEDTKRFVGSGGIELVGTPNTGQLESFRVQANAELQFKVTLPPLVHDLKLTLTQVQLDGSGGFQKAKVWLVSDRAAQQIGEFDYGSKNPKEETIIQLKVDKLLPGRDNLIRIQAGSAPLYIRELRCTFTMEKRWTEEGVERRLALLSPLPNTVIGEGKTLPIVWRAANLPSNASISIYRSHGGKRSLVPGAFRLPVNHGNRPGYGEFLWQEPVNGQIELVVEPGDLAASMKEELPFDNLRTLIKFETNDKEPADSLLPQNAVAFTADEKRVLVGGPPRFSKLAGGLVNLQLFDIASGTEIYAYRLKGHDLSKDPRRMVAVALTEGQGGLTVFGSLSGKLGVKLKDAEIYAEIYGWNTSATSESAPPASKGLLPAVLEHDAIYPDQSKHLDKPQNYDGDASITAIVVSPDRRSVIAGGIPINGKKTPGLVSFNILSGKAMGHLQTNNEWRHLHDGEWMPVAYVAKSWINVNEGPYSVVRSLGAYRFDGRQFVASVARASDLNAPTHVWFYQVHPNGTLLYVEGNADVDHAGAFHMSLPSSINPHHLLISSPKGLNLWAREKITRPIARPEETPLLMKPLLAESKDGIEKRWAFAADKELALCMRQSSISEKSSNQKSICELYYRRLDLLTKETNTPINEMRDLPFPEASCFLVSAQSRYFVVGAVQDKFIELQVWGLPDKGSLVGSPPASRSLPASGLDK